VKSPPNGLIRAVLNSWKSMGWVDVDNAALAVAKALHDGSDSTAASRVVSGAFLERNGTSRSTVDKAISGIPGTQTGELLPDVGGRIVVLTAIPSEYQAMVRLLESPQRLQTGTGTRYAMGTIQGRDCLWEVAVAEIGPGNIGAAAEVASATTELRPDLFLFVGIAGGLKGDLPPRSVVVSSVVHYYEQGRSEESGWLARPLSMPTRHRLTQLATDVAREWKESAAVVKPIAAGEALIGASNSDTVRIIQTHYNDAVAVDMESAGLYLAAHRAETPVLAVRGISDQLDDKSPETDARNQMFAARNAASFAETLLRSAVRADISRRSDEA